METEKIIFAAIKRKDNCILYGRDHAECINRTPLGLVSDVKQGFLTSTFRFVGRDEALTIALEARQLQYPESGAGLISEMLWHKKTGGRFDYDAEAGYINIKE